MTIATAWRHCRFAFAVGALLAAGHAQATVDLWKAASHFQYNIEKVGVTALPSTPPSYKVKVVFSVTDPKIANQPWDIKNQLPFRSAGAQLTLDIGWNPAADFVNTGSNSGSFTPLTALGDAAAFPVRVPIIANGTLLPATKECTASDCGAPTRLNPGGLNRYFAESTITPLPSGTSVTAGRVALEGHPVCSGQLAGFPPDPCPPAAPFPAIPARSEAVDFSFAPTTALAAIIPDQRRPIVDINKCKACHDDKDHGTGVVPRLSLHGGNRNENLRVCVICHNPNQTDVPWRRAAIATDTPQNGVLIAGAEVPVDFKVMVHSIHAGGFRKQAFVVIGFRSSVNDFSGVRFPKQLRDCTNCHIDANGKGSFELPLPKEVLGTTIMTQSSYLSAPRSIDVDPSNDAKISPTAAVCSACHDSTEVKSHMIRTGGASFDTPQSAIGASVRERCASCHGPGKEEDVRKAHEIAGGGGGGGGSDHHDD